MSTTPRGTDDMVVPENDDDIIEDYEELPEITSDTRRVKSAKGGPVERPGDDTPPGADLNGRRRDEFAPPTKGKVSKSTARTIWIVCILIILLGLGAVVADYQYNAFGRRADTPPKAQTNRPEENDNQQPDPELTPRQKLELEFRTDVVQQLREMDRSKAWDFYWLSVMEFEDAYDEWRKFRDMDDYELEDRDAAIARALKHYYKAKYAKALFKHRYDEDGISVEYFDYKLEELAEVLPEELLENPHMRTYTAAEQKLASMPSRSLHKYGSDVIKDDSATINVSKDEKWADEVFGEWEAKYEAAEDGEFAQEDLDFVNGEDYEQDEQRMFEKYLAEKLEKQE